MANRSFSFRTLVLVAVLAGFMGACVTLLARPEERAPRAGSGGAVAAAELQLADPPVSRVDTTTPPVAVPTSPSAPPSAPQSEAFIRAVAAVPAPPANGTQGCVPPAVVCQAGVGCAAAPVQGADDAGCGAWELPRLDARIAANATSAIVEVGTNAVPESSRLRLGAGAYTVAVEPLHVEGGQLWAAELATVLVSAAAGPARARIELSIEGVMSGLGRGPARGRTQPATVVPLREVVERLVPASVDARFLVVDAQGFDTAVVLSAGAEQLRRFRYVVIECQELWPEHPARYNPGSPTCSEASRLLASNGSLAFVGCMRNAAINEYNCLFAQRDHAVVGSTERLQEARHLFVEYWRNRLKNKKRSNAHTPMPAVTTIAAAEEEHASSALTVPLPSTFPLSLAAQQLRLFVPDDADAQDLAQMMCGMKNHNHAPSCNLVIRLKELNQLKVACPAWAYMCGMRVRSGRIVKSGPPEVDPSKCTGLRKRCARFL